jgi:Transglycosylase SLT domain
MTDEKTPLLKFSTVLFGRTENSCREFDKTTMLRIVVGLMLALGCSVNAGAKIVSFTDGRILKAADAYLEGNTIVIELRGGGTMRVPATRVDRVIADEVDDDTSPLPEFSDCPWAWDEEVIPSEMPFGDEIVTAARTAELHPWLLVALVRAESNFDPLAISRAGAAGLTQLMPATASDLGVTDVFDPGQNLDAGAGYLRAMLDRFGSLTLALAAYNAGPSTVERYEGVPPYRETRDYVRKVTKWFCGDEKQ